MCKSKLNENCPHGKIRNSQLSSISCVLLDCNCDGLSDGNKETPSLLFHYIDIELWSRCCGVNNFIAWSARTGTSWYVLLYKGLGCIIQDWHIALQRTDGVLDRTGGVLDRTGCAPGRTCGAIERSRYVLPFGDYPPPPHTHTHILRGD